MKRKSRVWPCSAQLVQNVVSPVLTVCDQGGRKRCSTVPLPQGSQDKRQPQMRRKRRGREEEGRRRGREEGEKRRRTRGREKKNEEGRKGGRKEGWNEGGKKLSFSWIKQLKTLLTSSL